MTPSRFLLLLLSTMLLSVPHWIKHVFGVSITTDQILFHIFAGKNALVGTDFSIYISLFNMCFTTPLSISMLLAMFLYLVYINTEKKYSNNRFFKFVYSIKIYILLFVISLVFISANLFDQYLKTTYGADSLTPIYVAPSKLKYVTPVHQKNLLLIYFESLEYNLQNPKIYGSNLIEPIDQLGGDNLLLAPAPGTGWSIAGMVSSQCSFPMKVYFADNFVTETMFLPGAICLGDILKEQGYTQYFLTGPNLKFADTDKFYNDHGFNYAYGLYEWKNMGLKRDLFTSWGRAIQDDTLLMQAMKILENPDLKKPYNLTLLTVDSHFPDGFASPRCTDEERTSDFQGAFKCSSRFLGYFIRDLRAKHLLDDTLVIIMGDHHFMNTSHQEKYFPDPRNVYFKIIDPDHKKPTRNSMTNFDIAPSILDALGVTLGPDTRFGLGASIYSNISPDDYAKLFKKVMDENILNRSKAYDSFWVPRSTPKQ